MAGTTGVPRRSAFAVIGLALSLLVPACSLKSGGDSGHEAPPGSVGASLNGPVTITLSVPNPLSPIGPVLTGASSVMLGSSVDVVSGTVVSMGSGGLDAEPGALVNNDVWSRGPATLKDRVTVKGTVHASTVTLGNQTSIAHTDKTPTFDPPSTLSWTVTYPPGTGSTFTVNSGQVKTLTPGLYGSATFNMQSTVNLSSGTYYFTDFIVNSQVSVNLNQANGPVIIYANGTLILRGAFVPMGGTDGGVVHPDLMIGYLGTNPVFVESLFDGAIVAPFAPLTLRSVTGTHTGYFYGQTIASVDSSARVQYRLPAAIVGAANPNGPLCNKLLAGAGIPEQDLHLFCKRCTSPDDTDRDGVQDCMDGCPYDHFKTSPGFCGCNIADTDSDGDGVPDCKDLCPQDPNNVTPGECGCIGQIGLAAAGTPCTDTACPQSGATCNGAGVCGNRAACSPCAGGRLVVENGVSYWFCGSSSQSGAQNACSAKGLTLTRINTPDENRFITQFLTAPLWLGANDLTTSGQWMWSQPGSNNGDLFWSGGANGSRQNNRYANWGAGAPGSARCASIEPGDGKWFDTNCAETLGYVCKFIAPPPSLPADAGSGGWPNGGGGGGAHQPVPFPDAACIPEFALDAGGLPDSLAELMNERDAAKNGVFIGAAANPPPDGSTCPTLSPDAAASEAIGFDNTAGCTITNEKQIVQPNGGIDGGPIVVDCMNDDDCRQFGASYFCRQVKNDSACVPPDGASDLDAGSCSGHALCVQLQCPTRASRCGQRVVCKAGTDFDASLDPGSNFDAGLYNPASMFDGALPDASPSGEYNDPPDGSGANHTWCHMVPQNPVAAANQGPQATGGTSGTGSSISIGFDPNLTFKVNANPLALGENGMDVHAAATLTSTVHLRNFLEQSYDADIVDIGAGIRAQRCAVNNDETQFIVLGVDVLSLSGLGVPQFDSGKLFPTFTKDCNDAVSNFTLWANRAKKAFRDAQQLLKAYNDLKGNGLQLASTLCNDILGNISANDVAFFPEGLRCPAGEPVEMTINRFIDYLQAPGFGQIAQLRGAVSNLVNKSSQFISKAITPLNQNQRFLDIEEDESQTILDVPFAIGPVPMILQIDVFASYGINGQFKLDVSFPFSQIAGLDDSSNTTNPGDPNAKPIPLAHVEADVLPFASAGLSAFVGAGVDLGGIGASVGIEGSVTLGQVEAPVYAGAGLDMLEQLDPRPIPTEVGSVSVLDALGVPKFHFQLPKSFNFLVWFNYGAGIQLNNILSGEIDSALTIDFFFFSETWRERIVKFNGWSAHFNLIQGGFGLNTSSGPGTPLGSKHASPVNGGTTVVTTGSQGGPSLGLAESQLPLTILQALPLPDGGTASGANDAGDAGDGGVASVSVPFDAAALQSFFYDDLCCAHRDESCNLAGTPQCCPDYECVAQDPTQPQTTTCRSVCVADGGICKPGAKVGCCGSDFCGPDNTCLSCVGFGTSCSSTEPCCGNLSCSGTNSTCCRNNAQACGSNAECCSGLCSTQNGPSQCVACLAGLATCTKDSDCCAGGCFAPPDGGPHICQIPVP
jgi:hypothetical protein